MSRSSLKRNFLNYTGNEDADSSRIFQWDENELEETQPEGVVEDSESSENEEVRLHLLKPYINSSISPLVGIRSWSVSIL